MLSAHIPPNGSAGILGYGTDFFATHEREIAFRKWMGLHRPDITRPRALRRTRWRRQAALTMVEKSPGLSGIFAVWGRPP